MSKIYGVYMAWTKYDVLPDEECNNPYIPKYPPEVARVRMYDNQAMQLDAYANTPCPASLKQIRRKKRKRKLKSSKRTSKIRLGWKKT